jgi:hypothetical protein
VNRSLYHLTGFITDLLGVRQIPPAITVSINDPRHGQSIFGGETFLLVYDDDVYRIDIFISYIVILTGLAVRTSSIGSATAGNRGCLFPNRLD